MAWARFKRFGRIGFRTSMWLGSASAFWIGIVGIPDDLVTWERWIDRAMSDPRVTLLAEQAVAIAEFVNQPAFRTALVIVGVLLIIWPLKRFWRFRHRLIFWGKRLVSEQVWISRSEAITLIRNSRWAAGREPDRLWGNILNPVINTGEKLQRDRFLEMTLEKFEEYNSRHVRKRGDGQKEYSEGSLRDYLREALDRDVRKKFGGVPDITID